MIANQRMRRGRFLVPDFGSGPVVIVGNQSSRSSLKAVRLAASWRQSQEVKPLGLRCDAVLKSETGGYTAHLLSLTDKDRRVAQQHSINFPFGEMPRWKSTSQSAVVVLLTVEIAITDPRRTPELRTCLLSPQLTPAGELSNSRSTID